MLKKDIDALPDYVKLAISRTCQLSDPDGMELRLAGAVRYQKWLDGRVLPDKPVLQSVK